MVAREDTFQSGRAAVHSNDYFIAVEFCDRFRRFGKLALRDDFRERAYGV